MESQTHQLCNNPACNHCQRKRLEAAKKAALEQQQLDSKAKPEERIQKKFGKPGFEEFSCWKDRECKIPKTSWKPPNLYWHSQDRFFLRNDTQEQLAINVLVNEDLPVAPIYSFVIEGEGIFEPDQIMAAAHDYNPKILRDWHKDLEKVGDEYWIMLQFGAEIWKPLDGANS